MKVSSLEKEGKEEDSNLPYKLLFKPPPAIMVISSISIVIMPRHPEREKYTSPRSNFR